MAGPYRRHSTAPSPSYHHSWFLRLVPSLYALCAFGCLYTAPSMQPMTDLFAFFRNIWEKPDTFCSGFYNTLPGSAHLLYFSLQHVHEGRWLFFQHFFFAKNNNIAFTLTSAIFFFFFYQIIYVGCAYATVYLIYMKFKATYDGNHDTFRVEFLVVPVGGLAFLVNHDFSPLEVCCM